MLEGIEDRSIYSGSKEGFVFLIIFLLSMLFLLINSGAGVLASPERYLVQINIFSPRFNFENLYS
jgi:hypothetical protein